MTRLDDRLRGLDEVDVPDVWRVARERGPQRPQEPSASPARRVGTIVLALLIAAAGLAFAVSRLGGHGDQTIGDEGTTAQPCEPNDGTTWRTKVAPWLTSILASVGAPDGQPLSEGDINDTHTALQIDAADGQADVVLYIFASVPDLDHDPRPSMLRTGSIDEYALYASGDGKVRQYAAISSELWLSLSAYASTPRTAATWERETDVHGWFQAMLARFAVDPIPSC